MVRMSRNVSTRGARVAPAAVGDRGPEGAPREPRYRDVSRWATRQREGPDRTCASKHGNDVYRKQEWGHDWMFQDVYDVEEWHVCSSSSHQASS